MASQIKEVQQKHNPVDTGKHQASEIASAAGAKMHQDVYSDKNTSFSMAMLAGVNKTVGASSEGTRVLQAAPPEHLDVTPIQTLLAQNNQQQPDAKARAVADQKFDEMVA